MNQFNFNPQAIRIAKARVGMHISPTIERLLQVIMGLLLATAVVLIITGHRAGWSLAGIGLILLVIYLWEHRDLDVLPAAAVGASTQLDQLLPAPLAAAYRTDLTAADLWRLLSSSHGAQFLMARFDLAESDITAALSGVPLDHRQLWDTATTITARLGLTHLSAATIVCALVELNPPLAELLTAAKLEPADLEQGAHWLARFDAYSTGRRPYYGGFARDWAAGFTPLLARYGSNLSQQVEFAGKYFATQERTSQLDALVTALDSSAGSVVLVGEPGIGKTALLLGLADRLLQGRAAGTLAHHQIVSLSASVILANAGGPGELEQTVLALFNEAVRAGNMVIALDEAQLFFGQGAGAVNLSQVLLPILQSRRVKLVLAITPGDWQRLRAMNAAMASLLTPLVLAEPNEAEAMQVLADRALLLEGRLVTTWTALREAYTLSGRYFEDEAYPGRALKLLEAAVSYPDGPFLSERSVQQAIESQFGVKVQEATSTESDVLLHLEDHIHERMINQTRAVSVVSNALRRARAGVANPKRPIGSFLFLGPTGVGKTELAKSLAALYFGAESNLIRLDMSEFQQISDVDRILASAADNPEGLLPRARQNPFSVVLFDEIEKAHPNVLNLFLQLLDEGQLTDTASHPTSFKDSIIIATSNAGADEIRRHIEAGESLESFEAQFTNDLIDAGTFKPELLNRFDDIVLFRPLAPTELIQVVGLMIAEVNRTLAAQKIQVALTPEAAGELVKTGYDPRLGARPMRRMVTRRVEDAVAGLILRGEAKPGDTITLGVDQLSGRDGAQAATAPTAAPATAPLPQPAAPSAPQPPTK